MTRNLTWDDERLDMEFTEVDGKQVIKRTCKYSGLSPDRETEDGMFCNSPDCKCEKDMTDYLQRVSEYMEKH